MERWTAGHKGDLLMRLSLPVVYKSVVALLQHEHGNFTGAHSVTHTHRYTVKQPIGDKLGDKECRYNYTVTFWKAKWDDHERHIWIRHTWTHRD